MRALRLSVLIFVFGTVLGSPAAASTPTIATYYDADGSQIDDCYSSPEVADIHVVALNVNAWVLGIRYKIEFPPPFVYLDEHSFFTDPVIGGTSDTGIEISYPSPVYFSERQLIHKAGAVWTCSSGCSPYLNVYIAPVPYPGLTEIEVDVVQGETTTTLFLNTSAAVLCPTLPVQQQTWGKIKALYR